MCWHQLQFLWMCWRQSLSPVDVLTLVTNACGYADVSHLCLWMYWRQLPMPVDVLTSVTFVCGCADVSPWAFVNGQIWRKGWSCRWVAWLIEKPRHCVSLLHNRQCSCMQIAASVPSLMTLPPHTHTHYSRPPSIEVYANDIDLCLCQWTPYEALDELSARTVSHLFMAALWSMKSLGR